MPSCFDFFKRIGSLKENELYANVRLCNVLEGKTCTPISLREFRLFLKNKERSLENLDFHFWYLDYKVKWSNLPIETKALSPPPLERPGLHIYWYQPTVPNVVSPPSAYSALIDMPSPLPPATLTPSVTERYANLGLVPESQPFRREVDMVLQTFFFESPKELNIEGHARDYVRYHSKFTTHPDVFVQVHRRVLENMQSSSLKNFINSALQNINYDGKIFRWSVACGLLTASFIVTVVVFSLRVSRWFRLFDLPLVFLAVLYFVSAQAGVCFTRATANRRELHDYELAGMDMPHITSKQNVLDMEKALDELKNVVDPFVQNYNKKLISRAVMAAAFISIVLTAILLAMPSR
ncbi:hypothetical protein BC938DRAFT_474693 [Jimgerdemannia flammicorona]|uniref:RGS domain-containing protein n=1 Tax=Jimgerdemannia flammicorona TaxID=994334 RepID=A0A433Q1Y4_9FUNG|nr:hypothetical protein BC938DRAFT_474693 [Jimgerdemannia flammicorona]